MSSQERNLNPMLERMYQEAEEDKTLNYLCCQIPEHFLCTSCKNSVWIRSRAYRAQKPKYKLKAICLELNGIVWQVGNNQAINKKAEEKEAEQEVIEDCSLYQPIE